MTPLADPAMAMLGGMIIVFGAACFLVGMAGAIPITASAAMSSSPLLYAAIPKWCGLSWQPDSVPI